MPRFDPAEFGRLLARLTPQELRKVEGMVAEARERAAAVLEIDARAGRRSKRTPRSHHINSVNALIGRFRAFMKLFCGPSSNTLAAYGSWHAARDNADRGYIDLLRLLLASGPRANTVLLTLPTAMSCLLTLGRHRSEHVRDCGF